MEEKDIILVLEDDSGWLSFFKKFFKKIVPPPELFITDDVDDSISFYNDHKERIKHVIVDYDLKNGRFGKEFLENIKKEEGIMFHANSQDDDSNALLVECGCDSILEKKFSKIKEIFQLK